MSKKLYYWCTKCKQVLHKDQLKAESPVQIGFPPVKCNHDKKLWKRLYLEIEN